MKSVKFVWCVLCVVISVMVMASPARSAFFNTVQTPRFDKFFAAMGDVKEKMCEDKFIDDCAPLSEQEFFEVLSRSPVIFKDVVTQFSKQRSSLTAESMLTDIHNAALKGAAPEAVKKGKLAVEKFGFIKDEIDYTRMVFFGDTLYAHALGLEYKVFRELHLNKYISQKMLAKKWKLDKKLLKQLGGTEKDNESLPLGMGSGSGGSLGMPSGPSGGLQSMVDCMRNAGKGGSGAMGGMPGGGGSDPNPMGTSVPPSAGGGGSGTGFGPDDRPTLPGSGHSGSGASSANPCYGLDTGKMAGGFAALEKGHKGTPEELDHLRPGQRAFVKKLDFSNDDGNHYEVFRDYTVKTSDGKGNYTGTETQNVWRKNSETGEEAWITVYSNVPREFSSSDLQKESKEYGYTLVDQVDPETGKLVQNNQQSSPIKDSGGGNLCGGSNASQMMDCIGGGEDEGDNCGQSDQKNWVKTRGGPGSEFGDPCGGGKGDAAAALTPAFFKQSFISDPNPIEMQKLKQTMKKFGPASSQVQTELKTMGLK